MVFRKKQKHTHTLWTSVSDSSNNKLVVSLWSELHGEESHIYSNKNDITDTRSFNVKKGKQW